MSVVDDGDDLGMVVAAGKWRPTKSGCMWNLWRAIAHAGPTVRLAVCDVRLRCGRASVWSLTNIERKMTVVGKKIVNRGGDDVWGPHVSELEGRVIWSL